MKAETLLNQPFITHQSDIESICKPLFDLGIKSYVYVKAYDNGSEFRLGNRSDWLLHYYSHCMYQNSVFEIPSENYQSGFVLWSSLASHSQVLDSAKNDFSIANGLTLIKRNQDNTEFSFYGADPDNVDIANYYLANIDSFNQFMLFFKERAKPIIQQAEKNKLLLQRPEKLTNTQKQDLLLINSVGEMEKNIKRFQEKISLLGNPLSPREKQIAKLLVEGFTAAQAGETLFLSRRTIEVYIANMKMKLHCRNKAELIKALLVIR